MVDSPWPMTWTTWACMCEWENYSSQKACKTVRTQTFKWINARHSLLVPPLPIRVCQHVERLLHSSNSAQLTPSCTHKICKPLHFTHKLPVSLSSTISHTHQPVPFPLHCSRSEGHTRHQPNSHKRVFLQLPVQLVIFNKTDFKFSKCLIKYLFNYFLLVDFQS